MNLISLNTWGGRAPGFTEFIERKKATTDIFCFQEVNNDAPESVREAPEEKLDLLAELTIQLADFDGFFTEQVPGIGQATFVRKSLGVVDVRTDTILATADMTTLRLPNGSPFYPRVLLSVVLQKPAMTIYNFHGVSGGNKADAPERDLQTERLLDIIGPDVLPKVLVGDFNANPDTRAIVALEPMLQNPLRTLGLPSTRSMLYKGWDTSPYADYAFVSKDIIVKKFEVLQEVVSDHLALSLDL
jgi:endonuclease/exonuclease/phosphatase family metal-dependent hydrolase